MDFSMNTAEVLNTRKLIEAFRILDANIPAQQIVIFLEVAMNEGINMQDLSRKVGLLQSTCSRSVAALSKMHRFNKPGLDLVITEEDPKDRRYKVISLSSKGRRLWEQIQEM